METMPTTGPRPPEIPDILLNWHMDLHLDIVTLNASPRSRKFVVMKEAQVQCVETARKSASAYGSVLPAASGLSSD